MDPEIPRLPLNHEDYFIDDWHFQYDKSHILHSQCSKNKEDACSLITPENERCLFCLYTSTLELPHLPDMVFPHNVLTMQHKNGARLEFNAYDALKKVIDSKLLQVSCASEWQESRPRVESCAKPFDWTFTTLYQGTATKIIEKETKERIDVDILKQQDKILFFNELTLYEDELHDHGVACLSVKIRVMPEYFFVLLRYFLRVDNVLVRINDTRFFHKFKQNYILKEFTQRETSLVDLKLPVPVLTDPNRLQQFLPLKLEKYSKLKLDG